MVLEVEKTDAYNFGQLVYFFEKALAISGYMLESDPFSSINPNDVESVTVLRLIRRICSLSQVSQDMKIEKQNQKKD